VTRGARRLVAELTDSVEDRLDFAGVRTNPLEQAFPGYRHSDSAGRAGRREIQEAENADT
jgi:hypothetical protein